MSCFQTRAVLRRLSLACVLAAASTSGHAQSSYSLTVLKPPSKGSHEGQYGGEAPPSRTLIDTSDQVITTVNDVYKYTYSILTWFLPQADIRRFAHRWPAGTGASVSGSRFGAEPVLSGGGNDVYFVPSHTGAKVVLNRNLLDAKTSKVLGNYPPDVYSPTAVNTSGAILFRGTAPWQPGRTQPAQPLGGDGWDINEAGLVAGSVGTNVPQRMQAATWRNGVWQPLPQQAGVASTVLRLNENGQMLVMRSLTEVCRQAESGPFCALAAPQVFFRAANGVETALLGEGDSRRLGRTLMNNAGTVVGCMGPASSDQLFFDLTPWTNLGVCSAPDARAYIWQKGVLSDLASHVASKGVKLPAGAQLTDVLAINDKGSLVVRMIVGTAHSLVRLTAKP